MPTRTALAPKRAPSRMALACSAASDQRLCRHAAVALEELAAHVLIFNEHGRHAEGGGRSRDREAAGIGADHADFRFELLRHPPAVVPAVFVCLYTWEYALTQELGSTARTGGKPASGSR